MVLHKKSPRTLNTPQTTPRPFSPLQFLIKGLQIASGITIGGLLLLIGLANLGSLIGCAPKAYESEAKNNIGSLNRAQQVYSLDSGKFTANLGELETGIPQETKNYRYSIQTEGNSVFHYAISKAPKASGWDKLMGVRDISNFVGAVFLVPDEATKEMLTVTVECQAKKSSVVQYPKLTLQNGVPTCPKNFTKL
ncbi:type IV pilin-like G/H family protein [Lusitaniella coriacea LEGE 07157]|uniref:Type IV pilin-like G/H family protein n=1 Tax=Lusitaniella coriacea LEGE 07157 TaxID=945747 RepID=A0A8J7B8R7_9CYAN|nr:type IV pilin-like G/H family protein [Lusitaniella coriacea]MBE9115048.1 type IV pilin-like G/H family protein [Lusitaniella coriacea LEGE 07157]